jgi:7-cyano-7-deazaguanine synthase in queuosine biosynthesis
MISHELVTAGQSGISPAARLHQWQTADKTGTFTTTVDPWLSQFGTVAPAAIDLCRVAVAAYLADQSVARPTTWSRSHHLIVHVLEPDAVVTYTDLIETLLFWLTGDEWTIEPVGDKAPLHLGMPAPRTFESVALLSGGLDSACGATLLGREALFLGHSDNTAVTGAQNKVQASLETLLGTIVYERVRLRPSSEDKKDRTTRTRSLLFMALAVALATAVDARNVYVGENGFTSLNPPLAVNRGGALTTRSTHPTTFAYINCLISALALDVTLSNSHQHQTKGELVQAAVSAHGRDGISGLAEATLSCAKLGSQYFYGGNPNQSCGVCVACMTRRGALRHALGIDPTVYLRDTLFARRNVSPKEFASWQKFDAQKRADLDAVQALGGWVPQLGDLIAMGPFPPGFDHATALQLLDRGMKELVNGIP